jgi:hypothetical protein
MPVFVSVAVVRRSRHSGSFKLCKMLILFLATHPHPRWTVGRYRQLEQIGPATTRRVHPGTV